MKKILLIVSLFMVVFLAKSQDVTPPALTKGNFLIETNLSPYALNRTTGLSFDSNDGLSEWTVGGEMGYLVADGLALKLGLGIYGVSFDGDTETALSYKVGAKYYVINQIPIQLDFGGLNSNGDNAFIFGSQVGYAWFVSDNIALEPGVRYDHGMNDNAGGVKTFSVRIGFSLFF